MVSEDRELVELEWLMLDVDDVELPSLEEFLARPAWHSLAACADEPRSTFFLARGEDASRAKAICAGCEVRSECLDYALGFPGTGPCRYLGRHHGPGEIGRAHV